MDWLNGLIPALRDEESLRKTLSEEEERAAKAGKRAADHADRQVTAAGEGKEYEAAARAADEQAGQYRSEAARLTTDESAAAVVPDPAVPLDTLRQNEASVHITLDRRTAQSVLADRVQNLTGQVAKAGVEIARHPAELQRHAQDLLATSDGQEPELRARVIEKARKAGRNAATMLGTAKVPSASVARPSRPSSSCAVSRRAGPCPCVPRRWPWPMSWRPSRRPGKPASGWPTETPGLPGHRRRSRRPSTSSGVPAGTSRGSQDR